MKFGRSRRIEASLDTSMTPLVDLFLNILIFFLVATTFASDTVFFVDLPETKKAERLGETNQVAIAVSASGRIAFNNQEVDLDRLKEMLEQVPATKRGSVPVVLRADRNTAHGKVVSVIDVLREVGFQNVGIVTETMEERG